MKIKDMMTNFYNDESGVTAVEYAIVIAGIASVCIFIFGADGPVREMLNNVFTTLAGTLDGMVSKP